MSQDTPEHRVLVLDDEEHIRKILKLLLERAGYQVFTAPTGEDALTMAKVEHPEAILLDIIMPAMNGHDVLRRLKSDPDTRDIHVIMVTAKGSERDIATSFRLGALFHVEKPFETKDLLEKLRVAIVRAAEGGMGSSAPDALPA